MIKLVSCQLMKTMTKMMKKDDEDKDNETMRMRR